jgi:hypothetical protein
VIQELKALFLFRPVIVLCLIQIGIASGFARQTVANHVEKPAENKMAPDTLKLLRSLQKSESTVLEQARKGEAAVFDARLEPANRTVRAEFIEKLLAGDFEIPLSRHGFIITNALIHGPLNLRSAQVPVEARFTECQFDDDVDFSSSQFSAPVVFDGSKFTNENARLNFNSMTVDGPLSFRHVEFAGKPEFYHLKIKSDLFATDDIRFNNKDWVVAFDQSQVGGKFFFQDAAFAGSLSLADITAKGLTLKSVTVQKGLDLRNAHIQTVIDLEITQPVGSIALEGLTYGDLSGTGVGDQLRDLLDMAPFSAQSYSQLDDYYRLHGYPEQANDVFIGMKKRERLILRQHLFLIPAYVASLVLDGVVGYGRAPQRALYISICVVLLGSLVFRRNRDVVLQKPGETSEIYSPLWYSLDLLTPFIDLHAASVWMPRPDWRFGRNYARIHRIIGWILVPIGIAAITGIIK